MLSFFASLFAAPSDSPRSRGRLLAAEPLETREMLAAAGLVDVGSQPSGALDGKIVYLHGGHGITTTASGWGYQRSLLLDMVEDLGNVDQMSQLAEHLWNAGATVVPLRPVGHQLNEVIVDNDDVGVTFTGAWSNSSSSIYFGDAGDVPYRYASTSLTETATAQFRPDLPEAGFYPVYAWARPGTDRAADQLYRVHHSGGATEVTVNHRMVGNGLVYLGTYYFEDGTDGYVEISNESSETGKVVIADMIRFGNGIGSIDVGNGVSGEPRENEAALYWLQWHVEHSQGISSSTYGTSTVSAPNRYAAFMNQAGEGSLSDRVYISYHSNASSGNSRGVVGLHNTSSGGDTPNQLLLAQLMGSQINDDLVAQAGQFERDWFDRDLNITYQANFNYGEINNSVINNEFDATIIESGFHDNQFDAEMLRDPEVREAIAKSTTQALVDYFRAVDGNTTPDIDAPPTVVSLSGESESPGEVTLNWTPGTPSSYAGSAATGYMVYASTNGYGFDGGTYVAGGATTTHTITGLTADETYYFRVAAVNAGGEAADSEVVAVKPSASPQRLLIVNGFDREDNSLADVEPFRGGSNTVDRVRLYGGNTRDYAIEVATAIQAAGATPSIATASNEAVANGVVDLAVYDAVIWITGTESSKDQSLSAAEQSAVSAYLTSGGKLFLSGAEIAWDLDNLNNGRAFYNGSLKADYVADDAGTHNATGVAGSIFEGLNLQFDDGSVAYDVAFPDVIAPLGGSTAALAYGAGAGAAAVQYADAGSGQRLVLMGFPFETLTGEDNQADVMSRVLEFFGFATTPVETVSLILNNDDGAPTYSDAGGWNDLGGLSPTDTQRFNLRGVAATATWTGVLPVTGDAEVFVQYSAGSNRVSGAHYTVTVGGESRIVTIDQRENDATWVSLGKFTDATGAVTVTLDAGASTGGSFALVIADKVRVDVRGVATPPNGDFNNDGVVNAADYTVWRDTLGQSVTPLSGADADGSGFVDAADREIWLATYGDTVAVSPVAVSTVAVSSPALIVTAPTDTAVGTAPITTETASNGAEKRAFASFIAPPAADESLSAPSARQRVTFRPTARTTAVDAALLLITQPSSSNSDEISPDGPAATERLPAESETAVDLALGTQIKLK
ncbi:AmiA-like protein [Botrimarina colliarenosi]|uniref:AmiA-like protein n=1 Tax=Botrimarina colliarenosi TaxID=2528001 RepID=A0A5C6A4R8_9BACT|nr:fibronectin type III domain-containing protein [Botrimarina colliarenosi]TWT93383.1 AmiA-like protein [Botrimarina colliarenosi]